MRLQIECAHCGSGALHHEDGHHSVGRVHRQIRDKRRRGQTGRCNTSARLEQAQHGRLEEAQDTQPSEPAMWGEGPIGTAEGSVSLGYESITCFSGSTSLVRWRRVLLWGSSIGGSGVGLILVIALVVYFMGGFRTKS